MRIGFSAATGGPGQAGRVSASVIITCIAMRTGKLAAIERQSRPLSLLMTHQHIHRPSNLAATGGRAKQEGGVPPS